MRKYPWVRIKKEIKTFEHCVGHKSNNNETRVSPHTLLIRFIHLGHFVQLSSAMFNECCYVTQLRDEPSTWVAEPMFLISTLSESLTHFKCAL